MIVKVTLDVKAEDLYDLLINSVMAEIRQCKPEFKEEELRQGMQYDKKMTTSMGQVVTSTVKIVGFSNPNLYKAEISSKKGTYTIEYKFNDNENGTTDVYYEESYKSFSTINQLNFKLVSILYKKKNHRRMMSMFYQMEDMIKERDNKQ